MDLDGLKAPFPQGRVNWRAQSVSSKDGKHSALALAYIDARDVSDRLDEVCGAANWQCRYTFSPDCKKTLCEIGIKVDGEWVWKADGAGDSDIESEKGSLSDAFKRAGVKWGIARYLYEIKSPWVPCEVGQGNKWKRFTVSPWTFVSGGKPEPQNNKADLPPAKTWQERCEMKSGQLFGKVNSPVALASAVLNRTIGDFGNWGDNHWRSYLEKLEKLSPEQVEDLKSALADPFNDRSPVQQTAPAQSLGL